MNPGGLARHTTAFRDGHHLTVLNYHNTPSRMADEIRNDLLVMKERFHLADLSDLDEFTDSGRWPQDRPVALPVFYEGYENHLSVAAPVCDEVGVTGWFGVCTGWIDSVPSAHEIFALSHTIRLVPEEIGAERIAMTWGEVAQLGERHIVFPHTASHAAQHDVISDADIEREIDEPLRQLQAVCKRSAPVFAWLHGTSWGCNGRLDRALIDAGYRYLISNTMVHRIA